MFTARMLSILQVTKGYLKGGGSTERVCYQLGYPLNFSYMPHFNAFTIVSEHLRLTVNNKIYVKQLKHGYSRAHPVTKLQVYRLSYSKAPC